MSPDEVGILIQDRVPAYISWEQYLTNQRRISENRSIPNAQGVPRRGEALLSGLIICGSCGHHMNVSYFAKQTKKPHYWCDSHLHDERKQPCYGLKAPPVDELVTQQVLRALEPATIGLSIQAAMDIERERDRLHQHWRQRVERARYNSQRAERQYQCVEPENRLVARTVEQQWEEALRQERQLREEYARFAAETPASLSASDQQRIRAAAESVSRLWLAPETKPEDRKEIIRCLVERVVVHVQADSEYVDTTIHWRGGFTSQHQVVRPVGRYNQLRDYDLLIERIKTLHREGNSLPALAEKLNKEGFTPPRRRGNFSRYTLHILMSRLGLVGELQRDGMLGPDEWWVPNLAARLEIRVPKIYYWVKQGWVHSRRTSAERHWIVWADDDELKRLEELRGQRNSYTAQRNPKLVTPKVRKV